MAKKFEISDYIYPDPQLENENYDWRAVVTSLLLRGDDPTQLFNPKDRAYRVIKVTTRFVYINDRHGEKTYRLDRLELETGEGAYHHRIIEPLYVWDAIKAEYDQARQEFDQWVKEERQRIESED